MSAHAQGSRPTSIGEPDAEGIATVTEIRELCRLDGKPLFQIALDHAPFPPTDSSMPSAAEVSLGTLTATSRLGAVLVVPILAVQIDSTGEWWHTTRKPLQPGTRVVCSANVPETNKGLP